MNQTESHTKELILSAAKKEFLEKGYQKAWLRDIAKNAGVTTGALYGYFKNKEELFGALVEGCYNGLPDLYRQILSEFAQLPAEEQQSSMEELSTRGMIRLADYMYENYDIFKLILCCSQDTTYTDLADRMARLDQNATDDFTEANRAAGKSFRKIMPRLEHILTTGLFTMFFELIVHDVPREEAEEYIISLMQFYTSGYSRIMGF